jgi:glutathione peroxidase-family protein
MNGIRYVRPGGDVIPQYPLAAKSNVNGPDENPIFSFLKRACPSTQARFSKKDNLYYQTFHERDVKWNFEKFLLDGSTGQAYRRYDASVDPLDLATDVQFILDRITPV